MSLLGDGVDRDRIRAIGKKVLGVAAGGVILGGALQLGLSDVDEGGGDALVDRLSADGDTGPDTDTVAQSLSEESGENASDTSTSDGIDFHRLSC